MLFKSLVQFLKNAHMESPYRPYEHPDATKRPPHLSFKDTCGFLFLRSMWVVKSHIKAVPLRKSRKIQLRFKVCTTQISPAGFYFR